MSGLFCGEGSLANHLLVRSPDLVPLYCKLCWLSKTLGNFSFKVMFCHSSGMNGLEVSVQLSAAVWEGVGTLEASGLVLSFLSVQEFVFSFL